MAHDPTSIVLKPTDRVTVGPFTWRRFAPGGEVRRTLIVLDDEFIGDAAVSATRARSIEGAINGTELILIGFDVDRFGALHQARGRYFTHDEHDLAFVGMTQTGEGKHLQQFLDETILPLARTQVSLLGYSLSGAFAINQFAHSERIDRVGLISPSLWIDDGLAQMLASTARRRRESGIFLTAGGRESDVVANDGKTMCEHIGDAAALIDRACGSQLSYRPFAQADHVSIITNAMDLAIGHLAKED